MEQNPTRIQELLAKYLRDECSDEERYELLFYLEDPGSARVAAEFMDKEAVGLLRSELSMDERVSGRILDRLRSRIGPEAPAETGREPFYQTAFFRVAASLTGLLILAGIALLSLHGGEAQEVATGNGQKRTVVLEDGSLVTLNGNSSVSFSMQKNRREVTLDGEAYFDVAHDSGRPFFVKTSQIEIRVLGTVFNVKSYPFEDQVEATLVEGKVRVKNLGRQEDDIELKPSEGVIFHKKTASFSKTGTEPEISTSWRSGNLFFEDEPARVIFSELEKWYKVKIISDGDQQDCRFSVHVGEESISEILGFFEKTTNVKVIKQGNTFRLEGTLCDTPERL